MLLRPAEGSRACGFVAGYGLAICGWGISSEGHPIFENDIRPLRAVRGGATIEYEDALIPTSTSSSSSWGAIESQITEVRAEIKAQNSRIDVLQRVIWPLIGLLATTVFGLLYRVVIATPG